MKTNVKEDAAKHKSKNKPKNKPKTKKKMGYLGKFFVIVFSIVGVFALMATAATLGFVKSTQGVGSGVDGGNPITTEVKADENDDGGFLVPPKKTNFLILGLDQTEALTDVILVGCFDRETMNIDLISIPRDTYVVMDPEDVEYLQSQGHQPPSSGVMKINAVHSYAGQELGHEYTEKTVEELLGIEIDYYMEVTTDAFVQIVDAVGGVDVVIPEPGLYYNDPTQDLLIDIPPGPQHLDGEEAEGVVRYRATYVNGDLDRIKVQQAFMKAFFEQTLNKETIMNNLPEILTTLVTQVNTNFGVSDIPSYMRYVDDLDPEKLSTYMLPGTPQTIDGVSYFIHDEVATAELVEQIFYSTAPIEPDVDEDTDTDTDTDTDIDDEDSEPTEAADFDSKELKVFVLNGGGANGLAGAKEQELTQAGYNVVGIDTYTGPKEEATRIIVKDEAHGEDFVEYFDDAIIEVDENMSDEYDVEIIIGLSETL